jgi:hypothetical protein
MKKKYPIMNPLEVSDYNENDDIFDSSLPAWLKKEMEKVAKIEKCGLRELSYKREIYFDNEKPGWVDSGEIIFNL